MKKILLLVALCGLVSCGGPQKKAEKAVKEHLKFTLNDPGSYDPDYFSTLDSLFESPVGRVPIYDSIYKLRIYSGYGHIGDVNDPYEHILDSIRKANKGEFIGYILSHSYRAKNQMGGVVKENTLFFINKNLTMAFISEDDLLESYKY